MNSIEGDILIRCLHMIYGQMLTENMSTALQSIERLTFLVRYLTRNSAAFVTLEGELQVIQEVFQLYRTDEETAFVSDPGILDPRTRVRHNSLVYEICRHGMELQHNGCHLRCVTMRQKNGQLEYTFIEDNGSTYGGTIYEEELGDLEDL